MSIQIQCDREGCHSQLQAPAAGEGWFVVHPMGEDDERRQKDFCSVGCMVQHYAGVFEVPETIPTDWEQK